MDEFETNDLSDNLETEIGKKNNLKIVLVVATVLFTAILVLVFLYVYTKHQNQTPSVQDTAQTEKDEQVIEIHQQNNSSTITLEQQIVSLTYQEVLEKYLLGDDFLSISSNFNRNFRGGADPQIAAESLDEWIKMIYERRDNEQTFLTYHIPNYLLSDRTYNIANDYYYQKGDKPMAIFVGDKNGLFGSIAPSDDLLKARYTWKPNTYYDLETGQERSLELNREYLLVTLEYDEQGSKLESMFFVLIDFDGDYKSLSAEDKEGGALLSRLVTESFERNNDVRYVTFVTRDGKEYLIQRFDEQPHSLSLNFSYPNLCKTVYDFDYDNANDSGVSCVNIENDNAWQLPLNQDQGRIDSSRIKNGVLHYSLTHQCPDQSGKCTSFYYSPLFVSGSTTEVVKDIPTSRYASVQLLESKGESSEFLFRETLGYECRQWYKKFVYDAELSTTTELVTDLDNECDMGPEGELVIAKIKSEIEKDNDLYLDEETEQCNIPKNNITDLVSEWFSYQQEIIGCYK